MSFLCVPVRMRFEYLGALMVDATLESPVVPLHLYHSRVTSFDAARLR